MKVRYKIIIILLPILLLTVLLINFIFNNFFRNYLSEQEDKQLITICNNIQSYFIQKLNNYNGIVKDWGHWDETYEYMNNNNPDYVYSNLTEEDFINLDVSFMILAKDETNIEKKYYDHTQQTFIEFPPDFFEYFNQFAQKAKLKDDTYGLFNLGDAFYFIATSDVTDSLLQKSPSGKLIIGRLVDEGFISKIEEFAGGTLVSINTADLDDHEGIEKLKVNKQEDTLEFTCPVETIDGDSTVYLTLSKDRSLYLSGQKKLEQFLIVNILYTLGICFIVFAILGLYMSRPITKLINEVSKINLYGKTIKNLHVKGNDEFGFLRRTINNMLKKIETEQNKVKNNEQKLYATLKSVGDGVIVVNKDCNVEFLNLVAQKLTGWTHQEALGKPFDQIFNIVNEFTREKTISPVTEVFETERIVELSNHTLLISKDGTERSIEDTAAPIRDKFNNVIGCVLVFKDFSEKKEKQKKIEYLSFHDQLTGLYNRRYFEEELKRLNTNRNLPISLIYADVNGLKTINDAFGHKTGDQLIQQVADGLKGQCRTDDIMARTGGDEFILLLPKTDKSNAERLANRIKEVIERQKIMGITISLSFGWNTKTDENQSIFEVLKSAEDFMYRKKMLSNSSKRSAVIKSILNTLYIKSPTENAHSKRVSLICESMGKAFNLNNDDLSELKIAGELHDIGKIAIDHAILNKAGKLSSSEWAQVRSHPETGYRILGTSSEFYTIAEYVLAHHERWDGRGYPKGLVGDQILWKSRIIAVADAYDAMTTDRPYRKALSKQEAAEEIRKNAGKQFDPEIVKIFLEQVLDR